MNSTLTCVIRTSGISQHNGMLLLAPDDPALLLGRTVFETLRIYAGVPFQLAAHLDRLHHGAAVLGFPPPDRVLLSAETHAAITSWYAHPSSTDLDASLRITLLGVGRWLVRVGPLPALPTTMHVQIHPWTPPQWLPGSVKHGSRAGFHAARMHSQCDEVLFCDPDGFLLEGTQSSIFIAIDGVLYTPPTDGRILAGITRQVLLQLARDAGIPAHVRPIHRSELTHRHELYLCSSLKELVPAGLMGQGIWGPIGRQLYAAFRAHTQPTSSGRAGEP